MKRMLSAAVAGLCAALLITGCSDIKELNKALGDASSLDEVSTLGLRIVQNKTTQNDVLKSIGAPSMTFDNGEGTTWVYTRVAVRNNHSSADASIGFDAFFPYKSNSFSRGGGIAGVHGSAATASQRSSYKTAALTINFNAQGCVTNYEFSATSF